MIRKIVAAFRIKPRYTVVYRCKACDTKLTWNEKMDSHGVCPYCGATSDGTVVDCNKTSVDNRP